MRPLPRVSFPLLACCLCATALLAGCPPRGSDDDDDGTSSGNTGSSSSGQASSSSSGTASGGSSGASSGGSSGGHVIIRNPDPDNPDNAQRDSDCDGLTDAVEFGTTYPGAARTDPHNPDSDGDGILDGVEAGATAIVAGDAAACGAFAGDQDTGSKTNPAGADSDADGIPDGREDVDGNGRVDAGETDPSNPDSDGDGLADGLEDVNHDGVHQPTETSASARDTDADGIPDGVEDVNRDGARQPAETDPRNPDSDGDGLKDGDEDLNWDHVVNAGETDPLVADVDTDGDGIPDFRETQLGYDPNSPDMDGDGLQDGEEDRNRNGVVDPGETNPRRVDTDCDGLPDGQEDVNGDGVLDPGETDPLARDSDGDLLSDGLERGITVNPDPTHCPGVVLDADPAGPVNPANPSQKNTDPRAADTDGDGLNDGIEDRNHDGMQQAGETNPRAADSDGDGIPDGAEDLNHNGVVDVGETDPLTRDTDTDSDGLPDDRELALGTGVNNPDSDGDGLTDGTEDANHDGVISVNETHPLQKDTDCDGLSDGAEDANHDGTRQATETDPLKVDTDGDGLTDGVELGVTAAQSPDGARCNGIYRPSAASPSLTDPVNPDSDGDGVPDGTEDANQNGTVDPGELNPKNGTDITPTVQQACAVQNLVPITFHSTVSPPDVQLATVTAFGQRTDITVNGTVVGQFVVDPDAAGGAPIIAFALARVPVAGETTASAIAQTTETSLSGVGLGNGVTQSLPCSNFPNDCTWDGFPAVLGRYDLTLNVGLVQAVNQVVTRILNPSGAGGVTVSQLSAAVTASGPYKVRLEYVRRSAQRAVIVGALMSAASYNETTTAYRLEDVTNGSALAQVGDETSVRCDTFLTTAYPKTDIMLIIDNSGSMNDDQGALSSSTEAILTQLQNAQVDWRIARITTDTDDPHEYVSNSSVAVPRTYGDEAGSAAAKSHFWPFIRPADNSSAEFARVSNIVRTKLMLPGTAGYGQEGALGPLAYVLTQDAQHPLLPATDPGTVNAWKLRKDAKFAVLIITDAGEQSAARSSIDFSNLDRALSFLRGGPNNGVALAGTANADTYDTVRTDEPAVFMGGIHCPLGTQCSGEGDSTGTDARLQLYHDVHNSMGGVVGNIVNIQNIGPSVQAFMTALIGNLSPYTLQKAPISASIKVAVDGQPATGCNWANVPRGRVNGFDYDGAQRQITFYGNCRPQGEPANIGKQIAVSYRYWVDRTADANGTPTPCGGACQAPLVCNPATNACECPSNCGMASGCAAPAVCDTRVTACACACPADCGGSPSDPRFTCNTATCAFECPADCGMASPGSNFACNRTTCQYECSACEPSTRPSSAHACNLATCAWECPADCGSSPPGSTYRCNPLSCAWECAADCGGACGGYQQCNTTSCACQCVPNATCAPGLRFDTTACDCVCDTAALNCGGARTANATTCTCECLPNCGNACTGAEICQASTCECIPVGG